MGFRVIDTSTGKETRGIPSPLLIEEGGGEAFYTPPENPDGPFNKGYWRLREGNNVSPDGQYTRVRIVHTDDWKVTVRITVTDPRFPEEYEDWFIVEASDRQDAETRGEAAAKDDVASRYGEDAAFKVRVLHTREGVSI